MGGCPETRMGQGVQPSLSSAIKDKCSNTPRPEYPSVRAGDPAKLGFKADAGALRGKERTEHKPHALLTRETLPDTETERLKETKAWRRWSSCGRTRGGCHCLEMVNPHSQKPGAEGGVLPLKHPRPRGLPEHLPTWYRKFQRIKEGKFKQPVKAAHGGRGGRGYMGDKWLQKTLR